MGRMFEVLMRKLEGEGREEGRRREEERSVKEEGREEEREEEGRREEGREEEGRMEEGREEEKMKEDQMKTDVIWSFINFCSDSVVLAEIALKKGLVGRLIGLLKGRTPELSLLKDILALLRGISGLKNIFKKDELFYEVN